MKNLRSGCKVTSADCVLMTHFVSMFRRNFEFSLQSCSCSKMIDLKFWFSVENILILYLDSNWQIITGPQK